MKFYNRTLDQLSNTDLSMAHTGARKAQKVRPSGRVVKYDRGPSTSRGGSWHRVPATVLCVCCRLIYSGRHSTPFDTCGRISRGHTGGRSTQELLLLFVFSTPPSFCGACLEFLSREGFSSPSPSPSFNVESNFVYPHLNRQKVSRLPTEPPGDRYAARTIIIIFGSTNFFGRSAALLKHQMKNKNIAFY
ncbi:unnamed protein product [Sphacelaria rigidula]